MLQSAYALTVDSFFFIFYFLNFLPNFNKFFSADSSGINKGKGHTHSMASSEGKTYRAKKSWEHTFSFLIAFLLSTPRLSGSRIFVR